MESHIFLMIMVWSILLGKWAPLRACGHSRPRSEDRTHGAWCPCTGSRKGSVPGWGFPNSVFKYTRPKVHLFSAEFVMWKSAGIFRIIRKHDVIDSNVNNLSFLWTKVRSHLLLRNSSPLCSRDCREVLSAVAKVTPHFLTNLWGNIHLSCNVILHVIFIKCGN